MFARHPSIVLLQLRNVRARYRAAVAAFRPPTDPGKGGVVGSDTPSSLWCLPHSLYERVIHALRGCRIGQEGQVG
eukprot:6209594-Pleurochrysis_carterae.AAC.1